jgi:magnesium transporter
MSRFGRPETGLAIPTEADIDEIESSSRLATRVSSLYLCLPLVTTPETTQVCPDGFVLSRNRLITIRLAASRLFDRFIEQDNAPIKIRQ